MYCPLCPAAADGLAVGAAALSPQPAVSAAVGLAMVVHKGPVALGLTSCLSAAAWSKAAVQKGGACREGFAGSSGCGHPCFVADNVVCFQRFSSQAGSSIANFVKSSRMHGFERRRSGWGVVLSDLKKSKVNANNTDGKRAFERT
jgi:hypothetical protein